MEKGPDSLQYAKPASVSAPAHGPASSPEGHSPHVSLSEVKHALQLQNTSANASDDDSGAQSDAWSVVDPTSHAQPPTPASADVDGWTVLECTDPRLDTTQNAASRPLGPVRGHDYVPRRSGTHLNAVESLPEGPESSRQEAHRPGAGEPESASHSPIAPPTQFPARPCPLGPSGVSTTHKEKPTVCPPAQPIMPPKRPSHDRERQSDADSLRALEQLCPLAQQRAPSRPKTPRPRSRLQPQSDAESLKLLEYWTQKRAVESSWTTA